MNVQTKMKAAAPVRPDLDPDLNNLAMSKEAQPLFDAVKKHIEENVAPITDEFFRLGEGRTDDWSWAPGQLELLEARQGQGQGLRPVELLPARRPRSAGASPTSTTPISPPSSASSRWRRSRSTAPRPTPATWKCWRRSARPSRRRSG